MNTLRIIKVISKAGLKVFFILGVGELLLFSSHVLQEVKFGNIITRATEAVTQKKKVLCFGACHLKLGWPAKLSLLYQKSSFSKTVEVLDLSKFNVDSRMIAGTMPVYLEKMKPSLIVVMLQPPDKEINNPNYKNYKSLYMAKLGATAFDAVMEWFKEGYYETNLRIKNYDPNEVVMVSKYYYAKGKTENAVSVLSKSLKIHSSPSVCSNLLLIYTRFQDSSPDLYKTKMESTRRQCLNLFRANKTKENFLNMSGMLAVLFAGKNTSNEYENYLLNVLQVKKYRKQALTNLILYYRATENWKNEIKSEWAAIEEDPADSKRVTTLTWVIAAHGENQDKIRVVKYLKEFFKEDKDFMTAANLFADLNQRKEALNYFERFVSSKYSEDKQEFRKGFYVLEKLGLHSKAMELYGEYLPDTFHYTKKYYDDHWSVYQDASSRQIPVLVVGFPMQNLDEMKTYFELKGADMSKIHFLDNRKNFFLTEVAPEKLFNKHRINPIIEEFVILSEEGHIFLADIIKKEVDAILHFNTL